MRPITFSLLLFDERSPGEPEEALARLVDYAWSPLLEALADNPHVRLAVRLSGLTLEWALANRPAMLEQLADLLRSGQIEAVGGPQYNVPLHLVPWRDAHAQLQTGARWIRVHLGPRPRGGWIPQGAWDPQLPQLLALAGLSYTFLDEGLVAAGSGAEQLPGGWVATERHGHALGVFPLDRRLQAMVPWARPAQLLQELRGRVARGEQLVTAAVPIEHLGYGLKASRWCWEGTQPWVPAFFEALAAHSAWLKTATPATLYDNHAPSGQVYPAAGTPPEAAVAILPVEVALSYQGLQQAVVEDRSWALGSAAHLLVGPPWASVLSRYDESNRLHKRMLRASTAFHRLRRLCKETDGTGELLAAVDRAQEHLFMGQSAGALHMGFNGSLADGRVRRQAWLNLLEVERIVARALDEHEATRHELTDYDGNGRKELLVRNRAYTTVLRPDAGGALSELHLWEEGNIVNTLARRPERWLDSLEVGSTLPALVDESTDPIDEEGAVELELEEDEEELDDLPTDPGFAGGLPSPPPRALQLGEVGPLLWTDKHRRGLFCDHLLSDAYTLDNLRRGQAPEEGDFLDGAFQLLSVERERDDEVVALISREGTWRSGEEVGLMRLAKRYRFRVDPREIEVEYDIRNRIHRPVKTNLGIELTLNLDSKPGPHRFLEVDEERGINLERTLDASGIQEARLVLADQKLRIVVRSDAPARLLSYPVWSVHRGRTAYNRAFQGTCLVWVFPLSLWGHEKLVRRLSLRVEAL